MPQNPQNFVARNSSTNAMTALSTDANGALLVSGTGGVNSALDITTATVVKAAPGRLIRVSVLVAGSAAGAAYDSAATGSDAIGTEIFVIPNTVGIYELDWPCLTGVTVAPGTGQTVAVSFS